MLDVIQQYLLKREWVSLLKNSYENARYGTIKVPPFSSFFLYVDDSSVQISILPKTVSYTQVIVFYKNKLGKPTLTETAQNGEHVFTWENVQFPYLSIQL